MSRSIEVRFTSSCSSQVLDNGQDCSIEVLKVSGAYWESRRTIESDFSIRTWTMVSHVAGKYYGEATYQGTVATNHLETQDIVHAALEMIPRIVDASARQGGALALRILGCGHSG